MRKLIVLLALCIPAVAQQPPGKSIVWTQQSVCQDPNGTDRGQCITDDDQFLITVNGTPYHTPKNFSGGNAGIITVGITTTGLPGTAASVNDTGTGGNHVLNFVIPQGANGGPGPSGTMSVGTVTTGAAGTAAKVTNVGTSSAAIWNFTIPQGAAGAGTSFTSMTCTTAALSNGGLVVSGCTVK